VNPVAFSCGNKERALPVPGTRRKRYRPVIGSCEKKRGKQTVGAQEGKGKKPRCMGEKWGVVEPKNKNGKESLKVHPRAGGTRNPGEKCFSGKKTEKIGAWKGETGRSAKQ